MAAGDATESGSLRWWSTYACVGETTCPRRPLGLGDELDDMLERIRSTRRISDPFFKCPACGHIGRGANPHVSGRATILALTRFGVAAKEPARALEGLVCLQKDGGLDLYGHAATSDLARLPGCAHSDER